jgi:hypothetical protein
VPIIELSHRPAAEILPLIQPPLRPGEGESAMACRLRVPAQDPTLRDTWRRRAATPRAATSIRKPLWRRYRLSWTTLLPVAQSPPQVESLLDGKTIARNGK